MKLTKKMIGESYPILTLPKGCEKNGYEFIIGQYYEVTDVKIKKIIIKDENNVEVSVYAKDMDLKNSFTKKEIRKQKIEDRNFGFNWISDKLNIILPDEYEKSNDEDDIKEMSWLIKADAYSKGSDMDEEEIELMLNYLKRKNKIKEYQSVTNEIERRRHSINLAIEHLLQE